MLLTPSAFNDVLAGQARGVGRAAACRPGRHGSHAGRERGNSPWVRRARCCLQGGTMPAGAATAGQPPPQQSSIAGTQEACHDAACGKDRHPPPSSLMHGSRSCEHVTSSLSPLTGAKVHFGADHVLFPLVALHSGLTSGQSQGLLTAPLHVVWANPCALDKMHRARQHPANSHASTQPCKAHQLSSRRDPTHDPSPAPHAVQTPQQQQHSLIFGRPTTLSSPPALAAPAP